MSVEAHLAEVVAACREKLEARERMVAEVSDAEAAVRQARETGAAADAAAIARRDRALLALVREDGVPARQVPVRVREALLAEGFTAEQIDGLGVSYPAVRNAVERPR